MANDFTVQTTLDVFIKALESELEDRYNQCEDFAATPSAILLAVLNSVAGARKATEKFLEPTVVDGREV